MDTLQSQSRQPSRSTSVQGSSNSSCSHALVCACRLSSLTYNLDRALAYLAHKSSSCSFSTQVWQALESLSRLLPNASHTKHSYTSHIWRAPRLVVRRVLRPWPIAPSRCLRASFATLRTRRSPCARLRAKCRGVQTAAASGREVTEQTS